VSASLDELIRPTKDEAINAVKAAAFKVTDPDSDDCGREIVHCFAGAFGADWDVDDAILVIASARDIAWTDHWAGHDLVVLTDDGRLRWFNVQRPETAQAVQERAE
jgi:hypothetical protein